MTGIAWRPLTTDGTTSPEYRPMTGARCFNDPLPILNGKAVRKRSNLNKLFDAKNGVLVILFFRNKVAFSVPQGIEITGLWIRLLGQRGRTPDPGCRTSLRQRSIRIILVTKQEMVERAVWISRIHRLIGEVML